VSLENFIASLRRSSVSFLVLLVALTALATAFQPVPAFSQEGPDRKVKTKVSPVYPDIARKMGLTGTVRLQVAISPNGSVKETKVIGGHPILVTAAVDAVKKWRFEPASAESTGTLEFKFDPGN